MTKREIEFLVKMRNQATSHIKKLGKDFAQAARGVDATAKSSRNANKELKEASKQAKKTTESVRKLDAQNLKKLQNSFTKTGRAITSVRSVAISLARTFGALFILGGIKQALQIFGEFEKRMKAVEALTQDLTNVTAASERQMKTLADAARVSGATTVFTAAQAAEGMEFLARTGFEANEILSALPATLDLAVVGQLDLARAADITSNIIRAFNLDAIETTRVADILGKTAASSNTNIEQLGYAMSFAAPLAATLGVDVAEAASAVGKLGDAGIQGTRGGTGLRVIMTRLIEGGTGLQDVLKRVGLTMNDVDIRTVGLSGALEALADKNIGATDALKIFKIRGIAPATVALRAAKVAVDEVNSANVEFVRYVEDADGVTRPYINSIEAMAAGLDASSGFTRRAAKTMRDNLLDAIVELKSALQELAISIGEGQLGGAVRSAVTNLTNLARAMSANQEIAAKSTETMRNFVAVMKSFAFLGAIFLTISKAGSILVGIATAVGYGIGLITAAIGAILASGPALVALITTGLILGFAKLLQWTSKAEVGAIEFGDTLQQTMLAILNFGKRVLEAGKSFGRLIYGAFTFDLEGAVRRNQEAAAEIDREWDKIANLAARRARKRWEIESDEYAKAAREMHKTYAQALGIPFDPGGFATTVENQLAAAFGSVENAAAIQDELEGYDRAGAALEKYNQQVKLANILYADNIEEKQKWLTLAKAEYDRSVKLAVARHEDKDAIKEHTRALRERRKVVLRDGRMRQRLYDQMNKRIEQLRLETQVSQDGLPIHEDVVKWLRFEAKAAHLGAGAMRKLRLDYIAALEAAEAVSAIRMGDAFGGFEEGLNEYVDDARNLREAFKDVATNGIGAMEDAFIEFAVTGEANFDQLINSMRSSIARLKLRETLVEAFSAAGFSGAELGSDAMKEAASMLKGGGQGGEVAAAVNQMLTSTTDGTTEAAAKLITVLETIISTAEQARAVQEQDALGGISRGLGEYVDDAKNLRDAYKDVAANGIQSMEDAFVSFAQTGKFEFKALVASILSDIARVQAKKALGGALEFFGVEGARDQQGNLPEITKEGGSTILGSLFGKEKGSEGSGTSALSEALDSLPEKIKDGVSGIGDLVSGGMSKLPGLLKTGMEGLSGMFSSLFGSIGQGLSGALSGAGGWLSSIGSSISAAMFHSGGIVGAAQQAKSIPAAAFVGAPRYHSGGPVMPSVGTGSFGLAPNEVPIIAQRGERVLTRAQQENMERALAGRESSVPVTVTIVANDPNAFRRSKDQVGAEIGGAVRRAMRRNG